MNPVAFAVMFVLLAVNGFFVAAEFALVGSRRTRLEQLAEGGDRRAATAVAASGDLTLHLAGAQLGITMASLGIGFVAEPAMAQLVASMLEPLRVPTALAEVAGAVIGLGIVVFLHLLLGEMVPKGIALADPERTLLVVARPTRAYLTVFRPLVRVLNAAGRAGARAVFRVEPRNTLVATHTAEELAVMLAESHEGGLIEDFAHDLLTGVLDFGGRSAGDVMVQRDDVVSVARTATVDEVERLVVECGHSRLPVTGGGGLDDVLGFVHAKDLLALDAGTRQRPLPFRLVRRMLVVPRERSLEDLLLSMRQSRVHFAVVVEPNKTVAGIVTLEDLLEELVGDILDESDRE